MMKLNTLVIGIIFVLFSFSIAEAHQKDGLKGLVIGGVGGAAIGHVVTESPEGMIAGSLLGGTLGLLIDSGHNHNRVVVVKDRHHRHWPRHSYKGRWSHRGDRHYYGRHGHKYRWSQRGDRHYYGRHGDRYRRDRHRGRHHH